MKKQILALMVSIVVFAMSPAFGMDNADFFEENARATTAVIKPSEITPEEMVQLAILVNAAYLVGEKGICLPDMERTSAAAVNHMIQNGELIGLRIRKTWRGCVRVGLSPYDDSQHSALFGMLAVEDNPQFRGKGYGSLLVDAAEQWAKTQGYSYMMLELLEPKDWVHPHKKMLKEWYTGRRNYIHWGTREFPHLEVLLPKQQYTFNIFRKLL